MKQRVNIPISITQEDVDNIPRLEYKETGKISKKQVDIPEWLVKFSKDSGVSIPNLLKLANFLAPAKNELKSPVGLKSGFRKPKQKEKVGTISEDYTVDSEFAGINKFAPNMNPKPRPESYVDDLPSWVSERDEILIALGNEIVHPKVRPQVQRVINKIITDIIPPEEQGKYKEGFVGFKAWTNSWNIALQYGAPDKCPNPDCGQSSYELDEYGNLNFLVLGWDKDNNEQAFMCYKCYAHQENKFKLLI